MAYNVAKTQLRPEKYISIFILFLVFYFLHLGASGTSAVQVAVVRYNHARVGHVQLYACCGIL